MSSPQIRGNSHNPRSNNALQATKNLPISFMPLDKIEPVEAKRTPAKAGVLVFNP
jgi:hypothetical protein